MLTQDPGTGFTIWLTGMHLSGKHTLARALTERLRRIQKPVELLEGGEWDVFLGKGPGATKEERNAVTRRAGFFARTVTRAGGFAVVPQISPYREMREQLRKEIGRFLEVFVDCPLDALMKRDVKGEYQKAIRGEIRNFIGITDPYEPPASPEVRIDSAATSVDDAVTAILEALVKEGALAPSDIGLARAPRKEKKPASKKAPPPSILFTAEMLRMPRSATPKPDAAKADAKGAVKAAPVEVKAAPVKSASKAAEKPAPKGAKPAPATKPASKVTPKSPAKAAPAKPAPASKAPAKPAPKAAPKSAPKAAAKGATKGKPAKTAPKAPVKPLKAVKPASGARSAPQKIAAKTARAAARK
jgi:adenylyl-sulfate kinase